jgi:hypothetical protein
MERVVALADEFRDLMAKRGEGSASIVLPTTDSSTAHKVGSESLKFHDVMNMFQMHLKPVQVH